MGMTKMYQKFILIFCTLGPIGYLPASGTIASLATIPLVIFLAQTGWVTYAIITLLLTILSFQLCKRALPSFKATDPKEIVIDELIGCLCTFMGLPLNLISLILGFIFFRIFDIFKIVGIARLEKRPGAWGIMLDDIAAGILANIVVRLITAC